MHDCNETITVQWTYNRRVSRRTVWGPTFSATGVNCPHIRFRLVLQFAMDSWFALPPSVEHYTKSLQVRNRRAFHMCVTTWDMQRAQQNVACMISRDVRDIGLTSPRKNTQPWSVVAISHVTERINRGQDIWKFFLANDPPEFIAMDILGPLPKSTNGNQFVVIMIEWYCKLTRAVPLQNMRDAHWAHFLWPLDRTMRDISHRIDRQWHTARGKVFWNHMPLAWIEISHN